MKVQKQISRYGRGNLVKVRMERDLFGSILYLAIKGKRNIEEVLTYPLTPSPLSLCHIDGKMSKKTKSTLMEELEKSSGLNNPEMVDMVIVIFFPINLKHLNLVDLY